MHRILGMKERENEYKNEGRAFRCFPSGQSGFEVPAGLRPCGAGNIYLLTSVPRLFCKMKFIRNGTTISSKVSKTTKIIASIVSFL